MNELEQRIESLKILQDWGKWLIGLLAGACALLWTVLKQDEPPRPLHKAWFMFWISIFFAAVLQIAIAAAVGQPAASGKRYIKWLWVLVAAEMLAFIAGMVCLFWRAYHL